MAKPPTVARIMPVQFWPVTFQMKKFVLWRQDDNGNQIEVGRFDTREEVQIVKDRLEKKAHKQIYWITKK